MTGLSRAEAEDLLFREAALIDDRRYREWLGMFTEDGIYWVPGDDPDLDPERSVSIIYDDAARRRSRIERLEHRSNWRDDPQGRLVHIVSSVLIGARHGEEVEVASSQLICHARRGQEHTLAARCFHRLRPADGEWRIALKKVCLIGADQYLMPDAIVLL